ncbi:MAG: ATP-binding cassette domain-containing protein [Chloroflexi bacterium]|nr:ATP-binding cassette domain-containing protein [Chloroflexota bacterium]
MLGLLGRTGSGKTTTRLLTRLCDPDAGSVRVGGVDLRETRPAHVRDRVGLVTQEIQLFDASVRDNLTFFDRSLRDALLLDALDALGLNAWLERLPAGLDTNLGAHGAGLSAGRAPGDREGHGRDRRGLRRGAGGEGRQRRRSRHRPPPPAVRGPPPRGRARSTPGPNDGVCVRGRNHAWDRIGAPARRARHAGGHVHRGRSGALHVLSPAGDRIAPGAGRCAQRLPAGGGLVRTARRTAAGRVRENADASPETPAVGSVRSPAVPRENAGRPLGAPRNAPPVLSLPRQRPWDQ